MKERLRKLFYKYFDYDIVRTYIEYNGNCYRTKHIRKYHLRKKI